MFCEDEARIRKLITFAMRTTAHEVHVVSNAAEGLALVEKLLPDVLFTDVQMPGMSGYELADAMRARPELAHIPIVFITASVQRAQRDEAFRRGAAMVLPKPFGAAELRSVVEDFLARPTPAPAQAPHPRSA